MATRRSEKAGLPPGSLVAVTGGGQSATVMRVFTFSPDLFREAEVHAIGDISMGEAGTVTWVDISGLASIGTINAAGERFGLHALVTEDILNTDHRPKVEEYEDHLFVVAKMLTLTPGADRLNTEQISFVLGRDHVISFQERPGTILDPMRERIRNATGRVRRKGADYLLYALLDVIVDHYFVVLEEFGKRVEELGSNVIASPRNGDLRAIQRLRGQLIDVSRYVTPMRELAGRLNTIQNQLIDKSTRRYLNDLQDHTLYIAETIGTYRELLTSLENTYHAGVNLRMGQVMKLLTVISTIFIPLTFIVGVYGMNFRHMPELEWRYGYYGVMGFMAVLSLAMLAWFKRKKWL